MQPERSQEILVSAMDKKQKFSISEQNLIQYRYNTIQIKLNTILE
jgi:hypothetical protein